MKKLLGTLSLFAVLAIYACNQNSNSTAPAEVPTPTKEVPAATEAVEATPTEKVKYVEHVCSDKCTAEGCYHAHGEKGHVCDENCD